MSVETNKLMNLGDGKVLYDDLRGRIDDNNTLTGSITTPAAIQTFTDGAEWPMEMEIAIEPVQSGTGDPSPSNVRPITGWDGANVSVTGKNLWDEEYTNISTTINYKSVYVGSGSFTMSTSAPQNSQNGANIFFLPGIATSGPSTGTNGVWSGQSRTISSVDGYVTVAYRNSNDCDPQDYHTQIEKGYTATSYAPFGQTYPITFPTSAGTVYGGTLTVHADGTGELVVDRIKVTTTWGDLTLNEVLTVTERRQLVLSPYSVYPPNEDKPELCNVAEHILNYRLDEVHFYCGGDKLNLFLPIGTADSTPIEFVYEPRTKNVYSLSAPQVLSIIGQNNIWADCGDINSITYVRRQDIGFVREDTTGQIRAATDPIQEELGDAESALEIVIDGDTAPKAITSGQYLFIKNHSTLATGGYHATSAISSGSSISSGNVAADADGVANSLNSKIGNIGVLLYSDNITGSSTNVPVTNLSKYNIFAGVLASSYWTGTAFGYRMPNGKDIVFIGMTRANEGIVQSFVELRTSGGDTINSVSAVFGTSVVALTRISGIA